MVVWLKKNTVNEPEDQHDTERHQQEGSPKDEHSPAGKSRRKAGFCPVPELCRDRRPAQASGPLPTMWLSVLSIVRGCVRSRLTPEDEARIRRDDAGVIWLGKM